MSSTNNSKLKFIGQGQILWAAMVFLVLMVITILMTYFSWMAEQEEIKKGFKERADLINKNIAGKLSEDVKAFRRLSGRMSFLKDLNKSFWLKDAKQYYEDYGFYRALEWADKDHIVRWVYPTEGNQKAMNLDLKFNSERLSKLELAKTEKAFQATKSIDLVQGIKGLLLLEPIYFGDKYKGTSIGVVELNQFIPKLLDKHSDPSFHIRLVEDGEIIYSSIQQDAKTGMPHGMAAKYSLRPYGFQWELEVIPSVRFLNRHDSHTAYIFIFGLVVSVCLSVLSFLYTHSLSLRRQAEEVSRKFEHALRGIGVGVWDWIVGGDNDVFLSDKFFELIEYNREEFPNGQYRVEEILHPDDRESCFRELERHLTGEIPVYEVEIRLKTKSSGYKWFKACGVAIRNKENEPIRMIGSLQDINIEKTALDDLKNQRAFFQTTVNTMPVVFYAKDVEGKHIEVNAAFTDFFNWDKLRIIGKTDAELFPEEVAKQFRANDILIIENKSVMESEEIAIDSKGRRRTHHSFKFPYFDEDGQIYATGGISLDITQKKELERQAFHISKLSSIGALAAGVGHEINNPLAIIKGTVTLLEDMVEKRMLDILSGRPHFKRIYDSIDRVAHIVSGLRVFSRNDADIEESFDLLPLIVESVEMVKNIYSKEGVTVSVVNQVTSECRIKGSRGRVQQVIMNLLANAKDATEGQSSRLIEVHVSRSCETVKFSVVDNGIGISDDIRDHIFDPFFTTKEVNKGTGIGLSLVHKIVEYHQGKLSVASVLGQGATFTIELPLASHQEEPLEFKKVEQVGEGEDSVNLDARVLLVDDEVGILEYLRYILESVGCTVVTTKNGKEAYEVYSGQPGDFDIIISDIKMPVWDGPTLLKRLRGNKTLKNKVKFVFYTGGVETDLASDSQFSGKIDGHFYKPFDSTQIISLLHDILGKGELH